MGVLLVLQAALLLLALPTLHWAAWPVLAVAAMGPTIAMMLR